MVDIDAACAIVSTRLKPADVVIVATKATQNSDITEHLNASLKPGSVLVIAQNGVVARIAKKHGIDVPLSDAVATLMRLSEPQSE